MIGALAALAVLAAPACARDQPGAIYDPDADAGAVIDAALAAAQADGAPTLIVFGANWCHDSRGFAERMTGDDGVAAFMAEHYQIVFVDIGVRHRNLESAARFGVEVVYGTPTLVVAGPDGETLNAATVHDWRAVYDAGDADLGAYFARLAQVPAPVSADAFADIDQAVAAWPAYQRAMAGIEALAEDQQAHARGYYTGLARSLARNAMGRVGEAGAAAIAVRADLEALGIGVQTDRTEAVIARMAEFDLDLEARRQADMHARADAALEAAHP